MRLKKHVGAMLLLLVTIVSNTGAASLWGIGLEDMPDSLKEKR